MCAVQTAVRHAARPRQRQLALAVRGKRCGGSALARRHSDVTALTAFASHATSDKHTSATASCQTCCALKLPSINP
ncbi:unnamed protein product [Pieris brassicae]|uniref:Uncharacterized protein n=1 Tax=Pieris brassicae TaxID=7116 RepID=A0A9P0TFM8_PIEBR|nr:unnamed protein product [Pieris brassicae]